MEGRGSRFSIALQYEIGWSESILSETLLDELQTLEPYTEAPAKDQAAHATEQVFGNLLTQLK